MFIPEHVREVENSITYGVERPSATSTNGGTGAEARKMRLSRDEVDSEIDRTFSMLTRGKFLPNSFKVDPEFEFDIDLTRNYLMF